MSVLSYRKTERAGVSHEMFRGRSDCPNRKVTEGLKIGPTREEFVIPKQEAHDTKKENSAVATAKNT